VDVDIYAEFRCGCHIDPPQAFLVEIIQVNGTEKKHFTICDGVSFSWFRFSLFLLRPEFFSVDSAIRWRIFSAAMASNRISGDVVFDVYNHPGFNRGEIMLTLQF
jgi:hypothetical protein